MDIEKFINDRPFLYHLTCQENAENIIATRQLVSANELIRLSGIPEYEPLRRQRRPEHQQIMVDGKCLTDGWDVGDFLNHLNDRVFMWPTTKRLQAHFDRYEPEKPVILRFSTRDVLSSNRDVKFCRLNSGATRSSAKYHGAPPDRGSQTFLPADLFAWPIGAVAEVTFEKVCHVQSPFEYGQTPDGPFRKV
jgi:hypothetical protein